jgi:quercetin dioxygenase-like cupin family protein
MQERSHDWQKFLSHAEAIIAGHPSASEPVADLCQQIFSAVQTPRATAPSPGRLPVCHHLADALDTARGQSVAIADLASAFAAIEPALSWQTRAGAAAHGEAFVHGHANATLLGPQGAEQRDDVHIGVSLLAPHTSYPMHRHPPREIYIVLSEGEWFQQTAGWFSPGVGNLVYNPSNALHAMRAGPRPLLALWFLGLVSISEP